MRCIDWRTRKYVIAVRTETRRYRTLQPDSRTRELSAGKVGGRWFPQTAVVDTRVENLP
jgi:hypothetical protein